MILEDVMEDIFGLDRRTLIMRGKKYISKDDNAGGNAVRAISASRNCTILTR